MLADRELLALIAGSAFLLGLLAGMRARSIVARLFLIVLTVAALLTVVVVAGAWHGLAEGRT